MASKRSWVLMGNGSMFLAPIVAMKLASLWFGASPPAADAYADASTVSQTAAAKVTPAARGAEEVKRQASAATYAQRIRAESFGPTPFYYEPRQQVVINEPEPEPVEVPGVSPVPKFSVQVIMASETEAKALIDGKIYRVGDEFGNGWIIAEIDSFARTVMIAEPATGRTSTQAVRMPGER